MASSDVVSVSTATKPASRAASAQAASASVVKTSS